MDPSRDNPLFRFKAAVWGLAMLAMFAVLALLVRLGLPAPAPTAEELAAAQRHQLRAEVDAAQQANLAWREIDPGAIVQVPPEAAFAHAGRRLVSAMPAAVERPEQAVPGATAPEPPPADAPAAEPEEQSKSDMSDGSDGSDQSDDTTAPAEPVDPPAAPE